jgi:hypothetical protein
VCRPLRVTAWGYVLRHVWTQNDRRGPCLNGGAPIAQNHRLSWAAGAEILTSSDRQRPGTSFQF